MAKEILIIYFSCSTCGIQNGIQEFRTKNTLIPTTLVERGKLMYSVVSFFQEGGWGGGGGGKHDRYCLAMLMGGCLVWLERWEMLSYRLCFLMFRWCASSPSDSVFSVSGSTWVKVWPPNQRTHSCNERISFNWVDIEMLTTGDTTLTGCRVSLLTNSALTSAQSRRVDFFAPKLSTPKTVKLKRRFAKDELFFTASCLSIVSHSNYRKGELGHHLLRMYLIQTISWATLVATTVLVDHRFTVQLKKTVSSVAWSSLTAAELKLLNCTMKKKLTRLSLDLMSVLLLWCSLTSLSWTSLPDQEPSDLTYSKH